MAILDNRAKTQSVFISLWITLPRIFRRLYAIASILLSLQLLYLTPQENLEKTTLEYSGSITNIFSTVFKAVVKNFQDLTESLDYMHNLKQENIALKLENARLRTTEERLATLISENEALKRHMNFVSKPQYTTVPARIVSVATSIYRDSAIVHAGMSNGIEKDQIVINDNGLIGRVIETGMSYSKIMLITDFGSRIPVISSHSRLQAVVAGIGESRTKLLYLPDANALQVGEILITSGDGKLYPAGLPVARVSKIVGSEVFVEPVVELSKIDFAGIIQNP